jgi:formylglycine-generating enzyme required for sulfatase activity
MSADRPQPARADAHAHERELIAAAWRELGSSVRPPVREDARLTRGHHFCDRYEIIVFTGHGGAGDVYQALDVHLGRIVALKLVPAAYLDAVPSRRQRLQHEIRAMAGFNHPHIVTIHDGRADPGDDGFLVMEFMAGGTLSDLVRRRDSLPWRSAVEHAWALCGAVEALHQKQFIHRDIKPDNILFTGGGRECAKLGDLGIVHVPAESTQALTQPGAQPGTDRWMAPEQRQGQALYQSDLFALGATLYFMLTGDDRTALLVHLKQIPPVPQVSNATPVQQRRLAEILRKALEREPDARFASAAEFREALDQLRKVSAPAAPGPTLREVIPKRPRLQKAKAGKTVLHVPRLPSLFRDAEDLLAEAGPGDCYIWPTDGAEMVFVPAGRFRMGCNHGCTDERPEHDAESGAYLIERFPVTNARYKRFLDAVRDYPVPRVDDDWGEAYNWDAERRTFPPGQEDYPVIMVSYADALAYAAWARKHLPTEAEWEKAACWDPRLPTGRNTYPWGPDWQAGRANSVERVAGQSFAPIEGAQDSALVWLRDEFGPLDPSEMGCFELLTRVYAFPAGASALGVVDLAGNVHEWCETDLPYRSYDGRTDPRIPIQELDRLRVCRGGSWADHPFYLRTSVRYALPGSERYDRVGFRCALRLESGASRKP